jgi:hypothetical protein
MGNCDLRGALERLPKLIEEVTPAGRVLLLENWLEAQELVEKGVKLLEKSIRETKEKSEETNYLHWCALCAGEIRESRAGKITRLSDREVNEKKIPCDFCGKYLALWRKEVPEGFYKAAMKNYREYQQRRGGL